MISVKPPTENMKNKKNREINFWKLISRIFFLIIFSAGGFNGYTTVRGCAPLNANSFRASDGDATLQSLVTGTYWNGNSLISICNTDRCNSSLKLNFNVPLLLMSLCLLLKM